MASIKSKFRPSALSDREGTIYYQIIHERKVRQLQSRHKILTEEWDPRRSTPIITPTNHPRHGKLSAVREAIRCDMERLARIIRHLDSLGLPYSADDITDEFERYSTECTIVNYMQSMIATLKLRNQFRTSETYQATLNSFRRFLTETSVGHHASLPDDMMLDAITSETMQTYEAYLKAKGNTPNTTSFYMRILRAVYNNAVERDAIVNRNPFRKVFTGVAKTVKRALPLATVRKIRNLDLSSSPRTAYARDMFMMSFYLRGMSFIDMAFLRKSDLINGHLTYRRRKTGQQLHIAWTSEMQTILDRYPTNPTSYLLPIITRENCNQRNAYRSIAENINLHLKKIAAMVGVTTPLTLYVARHSWASAAKAKNIPLSVISECMGHDSETTTQIYLASLETSVVDRANALILSSL